MRFATIAVPIFALVGLTAATVSEDLRVEILNELEPAAADCWSDCYRKYCTECAKVMACAGCYASCGTICG